MTEQYIRNMMEHVVVSGAFRLTDREAMILLIVGLLSQLLCLMILLVFSELRKDCK